MGRYHLFIVGLIVHVDRMHLPPPVVIDQQKNTNLDQAFVITRPPDQRIILTTVTTETPDAPINGAGSHTIRLLMGSHSQRGYYDHLVLFLRKSLRPP